MTYLTAEQVLNATDTDIGEVDVPEWGGRVLVRGLDAKYVSDLIQKGFIKPGKGGEGDEQEIDLSKIDFIDIAARSLADEKGERLLTRDQMKRMDRKSFPIISRIAQKALELAGLSAGEESEEAAEGTEDTDEKNE